MILQCSPVRLFGRSGRNPLASSSPPLDDAQAQRIKQAVGWLHTARFLTTAAQQHPEYIAKQLVEYKSGKRANAIMSGLAASLSEEDARNIGAFLATKTAKPGFAKDKDLATLGEKIYRGGIADRQIPACAGCHSPTGAGIPSQYPRMAGQHAEYTTSQLTQFRDGVRLNSLQMGQVAAKLNDKEIKALYKK